MVAVFPSTDQHDQCLKIVHALPPDQWWPLVRNNNLTSFNANMQVFVLANKTKKIKPSQLKVSPQYVYTTSSCCYKNKIFKLIPQAIY